MKVRFICWYISANGQNKGYARIYVRSLGFRSFTMSGLVLVHEARVREAVSQLLTTELFGV
jgi:hypothetical protein